MNNEITFEQALAQRNALQSKLSAINTFIEAFFPDRLQEVNNTQIQAKTPETLGSKAGVSIRSMITDVFDKITRPEMVKLSYETIGQGKVVDAANVLKDKFDYNGDFARAVKDVRIYTSALKTKGEIVVVTEGYGNTGSIYKLK